MTQAEDTREPENRSGFRVRVAGSRVLLNEKTAMSERWGAVSGRRRFLTVN